jgi:hypothetical protein
VVTDLHWKQLAVADLVSQFDNIIEKDEKQQAVFPHELFLVLILYFHFLH